MLNSYIIIVKFPNRIRFGLNSPSIVERFRFQFSIIQKIGSIKPVLVLDSLL